MVVEQGADEGVATQAAGGGEGQGRPGVEVAPADLGVSGEHVELDADQDFGEVIAVVGPPAGGEPGPGQGDEGVDPPGRRGIGGREGGVDLGRSGFVARTGVRRLPLVGATRLGWVVAVSHPIIGLGCGVGGVGRGVAVGRPVIGVGLGCGVGVCRLAIGVGLGRGVGVGRFAIGVGLGCVVGVGRAVRVGGDCVVVAVVPDECALGGECGAEHGGVVGFEQAGDADQAVGLVEQPDAAAVAVVAATVGIVGLRCPPVGRHHPGELADRHLPGQAERVGFAGGLGHPGHQL